MYFLDIVWDVHPIIFQFGALQIRYYGLLFAAGIFIGYLHWRQQMMTRLGYEEDTAEDFVMWGFFAILIGARLGHCLFYDPEYFLSNPIEILKIYKGGLASHGATIALILVLFRHHIRYKIPFRDVLDSLTLSAGACAITIRLGNFMNSELVGRVTDFSWGIKFPIHAKMMGVELQTRHPSQLYEVFLGIIVYVTLLLIDRHYKEKRPRGLLISVFFLVYFSGRFIVEYFKEYQVLTSGLTMGQWLSVPFVLTGLYLLLNVVIRPEYTEKKLLKNTTNANDNIKKQPKKKSKNKKKKS
ncbi:prolipoprotein diacylglyceryl transferase [Candidatus Uabimicrobium sp. HlEnr_7]|uniref:prolipoprotein diacylglyceryl transferase n=1 Tax=Candidatus Uabimicrobium helgolandensis TaxID=3095367 RepID=UPI003556683A